MYVIHMIYNVLGNDMYMMYLENHQNNIYYNNIHNNSNKIQIKMLIL